MDPLAPEPRRPRPVAGLPAVDSRVVAKTWLIELIAAAPLEAAVELPTSELAREGPDLAAAVLAALADDTALMRLAPGGDLAWLSARTAGLTGSTGAAGAVRAAEALRRATQAAILTGARLDAVTIAELADRLAHVCALVAEAAAGESPAAEPAPFYRAETYVQERSAPRPEPVSDPEGELVDLHRNGAPEGLRAHHDRGAEQGSLETAIERGLERHAHDGSPFALLAVEADGLQRLRAAQQEAEVEALLETLERSLAAELRPADQLLRDEPGRYWVTAPDTGAGVGREIAQRLATAVTAAVAHRGVPLTVSIGVAACPEDGVDAATLSAKADRAMFQARAAGTPVV